MSANSRFEIQNTFLFSKTAWLEKRVILTVINVVI
jgi:hypothetical protein